MENKLKESTLIENAMVIVEGHKFPAALIIPSFANLKSWCERNEIPYTTNAEMIKNPKVMEKIQKEVDKVNSSLAHYEMIKKFEVLPTEWTIDKGELTPKLSLKRKEIMRINEDCIKRIYSSEMSI